jgi:hypothetical protein
LFILCYLRKKIKAGKAKQSPCKPEAKHEIIGSDSETGG